MTSSQAIELLTFPRFSELLRAGGPIENAELDIAWLEGADLRDIEFRDCFFEPGSEFSNLDLRETVWKNVQFPAAFFKSCDLRAAKFENCSFYYTDTRNGGCFRHSDLSDAEFHNCDLRLTTFPYAQMSGIAFQNSRMTGASLEGCDFGRVYSKRALKPRAAFTDCLLTYATLCDLNLEDCTMTDCDLSGSNLANTSLVNADLRRSSLTDVETDGLDLTYADLREADVGALFLTTLRGYRGMLISASQQHHLLQGLGIKVEPD